MDEADQLDEHSRRENDEKKLRQLEEMADRVLGPIHNMDPIRIAISVPAVATKPLGYFENQVRRAAVMAAARYQAKGEPIPMHVRSALDAGLDSAAEGRTDGDQITEKNNVAFYETCVTD